MKLAEAVGADKESSRATTGAPSAIPTRGIAVFFYFRPGQGQLRLHELQEKTSEGGISP